MKEILDNDGFDMLLLLANSDAPLTLLNEIENTGLKLKSIRILIDQILHCGNTDERFIALELIDGKLVESSICFVNIDKCSKIREISSRLLCDNNLVESSILSTIQKRMLGKGIAI